MNIRLKKRLLPVFLFSLVLLMAACAAPRVTIPPAATPTATTPPVTSPTTTIPPGTTPADAPAGYVDPSMVDSTRVTFPGEGVTISGYLSRPRTKDIAPGLIIIHENRGLTAHIEDVARRYASQGYVVLAPDLLSRVGGTGKFASDSDATAALNQLDREGVIKDLNAAFAFLESRGDVRKDRIGVLGYCWGGGNSLLFATRNPNLKAAVVYYGPNPSNIDDVANIKASVLGIYGQEDTRITKNVPALEEAMKRFGKSFEFKSYPGAAHAFFNDTGTRFHRESAMDAWPTTLAFLQKTLKG